MASDVTAPAVWAVSDGRAGIENQALGLAEAIAAESAAQGRELQVLRKRVALRGIWGRLPALLQGDPFAKLAPDADRLDPPFPAFWVGCGRLATSFTIAARTRAPSTFRIQLQNPHAPSRLFDLVAPPAHDDLKGGNVAPTLGALNRVTPERLEADAALAASALESLPRPRIAVFIGGANKALRPNADDADRLAEFLKKTAGRAGLMVSFSRRTPSVVQERVKAALQPLASKGDAYLWDGAPLGPLANPYFAMLGGADAVIVTADSVNMASEAATAGKPIHVHYWRKTGNAGGPKFNRFHEQLAAERAARAFDGEIALWSYAPIDETRRIARLAVDLASRRDKAPS